MQNIINQIVLKQKFYGLLPHYKVIEETIDYNENILKVQAEVLSKISKYKFMNKVLSKIIDQELLHLCICFTFDPCLHQVRIEVNPKSKTFFNFNGTFYCLENFEIINYDMDIKYDKSFEIVKKLFDKRIRSLILDQTKRDIKLLHQTMEDSKKN
jgi:hypothetical protein